MLFHRLIVSAGYSCLLTQIIQACKLFAQIMKKKEKKNNSSSSQYKIQVEGFDRSQRLHRTYSLKLQFFCNTSKKKIIISVDSRYVKLMILDLNTTAFYVNFILFHHNR